MDGRPVLVTTGPSAQASAEVLQRLAGLGVPEVIAISGDVVTTTWAPPLAASHVDWASVAETLAAAHDRGVTHGDLSPSSILAGQVVAGWLGTGTPADDVVALGAMLTDPGLAQRALTADPSARPTMRALADAMIATSAPAPHRRHVHPRSARGPAVAAGMVFVLVGLLIVGPTSPSPTARRTDQGVPVLTSDGVRWSAGQAGDVATVADWDCDGEATPVLLRPGEGIVWGFPDWTPTARPRVLAHYPEATALRVTASSGCDRVRPGRR